MMSEAVYEDFLEARKSCDLDGSEDTSEGIYMNDFRKTPASRSNEEAVTSEPRTAGRSGYILAVCLLVLVILLLLPAIIILLVKNNNLIMGKDQLETSYNNLTAQKDQFKASCNNLTAEKDQLETSYTKLTAQKDQLETSYNNLTAQKDQLETSYNNLTAQKDQLETSYTKLTAQKDQLETSYTKLTAQKDQLETSYNNLTAEKDQLETSYKQVAEERGRFQRERDDLQKKFSELKNALDTMGWKYFSSSIYYIEREKKSWSESREECRRRGADLVIINSREEQDFVDKFRIDKGIWIGANDRNREGTWTWVDDTAVTNGLWSPGEPNNVGDEDCAVSYDATPPNWIDVSCDRGFMYICEKRTHI